MGSNPIARSSFSPENKGFEPLTRSGMCPVVAEHAENCTFDPCQFRAASANLFLARFLKFNSPLPSGGRHLPSAIMLHLGGRWRSIAFVGSDKGDRVVLRRLFHPKKSATVAGSAPIFTLIRQLNGDGPVRCRVSDCCTLIRHGVRTRAGELLPHAAHRWPLAAHATRNETALFADFGVRELNSNTGEAP